MTHTKLTGKISKASRAHKLDPLPAISCLQQSVTPQSGSFEEITGTNKLNMVLETPQLSIFGRVPQINLL